MLVLGGTEGVNSFLVLRSRTHFVRYRGCRSFHILRSKNRLGWYRGRQVPFSCFALPDSFWAVPRTSGPVFTFCAAGLIFGSTEGVRSSFHVLRSQTSFGRHQERQGPFSCFALSDSFWAIPRALGIVLMFCAPGPHLGGIEGAGSRFHVLLSRNRLGWYRGRQVPFSWFVLLDSISAEPRALSPVFMFSAPGLIFGGTEGAGSRFHILRSRTRFGWYRERQVPFSCFALPDSFWVVPRA
jgi:hypothetical protein